MSADDTQDMERSEQSADGASSAAEPVKRFVAFFSYAHADEDLAAKLHKQIETYRLPSQLKGATGAAGRLGKVFRDRADLAAADSLSEAIRGALADSGALIVLCSPAAVQSRWVNEEIRLFRSLNPGAPVLAAVVRGEPVDAMPAALTEDGREPLAADLREEGDGRKLGFLKIVAALAGVPLDALIQRDAQRKLRRVMAVTAGALVAMVAAVSMMTYAIQQRNEANRQRAQAEGLVEFMLTDLRERLRGVGRLDIMRSAASRALDSFGDQGETSELSPDSRSQLARLLHAVGEDDFNSGRNADAERSFRAAFRETSALLQRDRNNPDRIFAHAQSEYWLGYLSFLSGRHADARPHFEQYKLLAVRLSSVEPDSRRSSEEVGYAFTNLCALGRAERRDVVRECERSVAEQRRLVARWPTEPELQVTLANRLAWLADAVALRDGPGADEPYREEQLLIMRQLVRRSPEDWQGRDRLASALLSRVRGLIASGQVVAARPVLAEAQREIRLMLTHDPANRRWRDLSMIGEQMNSEIGERP